MKENFEFKRKLAVMIKSVFDLEAFNLAYSFAMEIFHATREFPKEERCSLTDQIVGHQVDFRPPTSNFSLIFGEIILIGPAFCCYRNFKLERETLPRTISSIGTGY